MCIQHLIVTDLDQAQFIIELPAWGKYPKYLLHKLIEGEHMVNTACKSDVKGPIWETYVMKIPIKNIRVLGARFNIDADSQRS